MSVLFFAPFNSLTFVLKDALGTFDLFQLCLTIFVTYSNAYEWFTLPSSRYCLGKTSNDSATFNGISIIFLNSFSLLMFFLLLKTIFETGFH